VIDETIRLFPPVWADPKVALNDDVLPGGQRIPKDTVIAWSAWNMGRNPAVWHQPEKFNPERWFGDNGGIPLDPLGFTPFQAGPRLCLGIQMAYLEVKVMTVLILQQFHLRHAPGHVVMPVPNITTGIKGGLPMIPMTRKKTPSMVIVNSQ